MATAALPSGLSLAKLPLAGKVGLGALFTVLVALLYWVFFFTEASAKIDQQTKSSGDLQQQLAQAQQAHASYQIDRDDLVVRQQRQRELNKVLPQDTQAASFLSSIQQVSNVSGIDLKAWQPMDEQSQQFFAKVPMKLELTGRFHQVAKFIYEVGKLDRIINIENLELTEPKAEGDDIVLKARCLATAFHTLKATASPVTTASTAQAGAPSPPPFPAASGGH